MTDYDKVGLLCVRDGRVLLCRKRQGTALLILPGGCREPGETSMDCLTRELREELGPVRLLSSEYIGVYTHRAADAGKTLRVELYRGDLEGEPAPESEVSELVWFSEHDERAQLSPSLAEVIVPDLVRRGLLPWR